MGLKLPQVTEGANFVISPSGPINDQGTVSGGAVTFDFSVAPVHKVVIGANTTFTFTGGKDGGDTMKVIIIQDGTGTRTATWPANFKRVNNVLTLSTTANRIDIITATFDGTNWLETTRSLNVQ